MSENARVQRPAAKKTTVSASSKESFVQVPVNAFLAAIKKNYFQQEAQQMVKGAIAKRANAKKTIVNAI